MNKLTLEFTKEVGKLLENWKEIMELYFFLLFFKKNMTLHKTLKFRITGCPNKF